MSLIFPFLSSRQAERMAEFYTSQWTGSDTEPVRVSGKDMEHYLTSEAKERGLGDFNRNELIAATFQQKGDNKGELVSRLKSGYNLRLM